MINTFDLTITSLLLEFRSHFPSCALFWMDNIPPTGRYQSLFQQLNNRRRCYDWGTSISSHIFKANDVNEKPAWSGVGGQRGSVVHLFVIGAFCKEQWFGGITVRTAALTDIELQESCMRCVHTWQSGHSQSTNNQLEAGALNMHTFQEVDQGFSNYISQVITRSLYLVQWLLPLYCHSP